MTMQRKTACERDGHEWRQTGVALEVNATGGVKTVTIDWACARPSCKWTYTDTKTIRKPSRTMLNGNGRTRVVVI